MQSFKYPFFQNSLRITYSEKGVTEVLWQKKKAQSPKNANAIEKKIMKILDQFLAGQADARELPIDWKNMEGTDFQKQVWKKMAQIPFGKTQSYGEIAQSLNKPGAARAVGTACGKNPVLLAIPCHRVVGRQGLGGFSGGGLSVKRRLLSLEGHTQYA
jgi:O-6-methylguanine DNA methyltransferase